MFLCVSEAQMIENALYKQRIGIKVSFAPNGPGSNSFLKTLVTSCENGDDLVDFMLRETECSIQWIELTRDGPPIPIQVIQPQLFQSTMNMAR